MLSKITNVSVPPDNKAVWAPMLLLTAGIHQDGILKNPLTYEIIDPGKSAYPRDVWCSESIRAATPYRSRLADLGYETTDAALAECYRLAIAQADAEKEITGRDLISIIHKGAAARLHRRRLALPRTLAETDRIQTCRECEKQSPYYLGTASAQK